MLNSWVRDACRSFCVAYCNPCTLGLLICKVDLLLRIIICRCPLIEKVPGASRGIQILPVAYFFPPKFNRYKNVSYLFSKIHVFSITVNNAILDRNYILSHVIMCISLNHLYVVCNWVCTD